MNNKSFIFARTTATLFALALSATAHADLSQCRDVFGERPRAVLGLAVKKLDTPKETTNTLNQTSRRTIDFTQLKTSDFRPAFEAAVEASKIRLEAIRQDPRKPTFENTIEALEVYAAPFERVQMALGHLIGVKGTDELRAISKDAFKFAQSLDNGVRDDKVLRTRVEKIIAERESLGLSLEQKKLLARVRNMFEWSAEKDPTRDRIDEINSRLNVLTTEFGASLTKDRAQFRFKVTEARDLEGLSEALKNAARARSEAEGDANAWSFNLGEVDSILVQSTLTHVRKRAWIARARIGQKRSASDNRERVIEIAKLREERAHLAEHKNAASLKLKPRMAKTPENAIKFLEDLAERYRPGALKDKAELDAFAGHEVKPWDVARYVSQMKKQRFGYSESVLREYFPLDQVLEGFFFTAKKLFGVSFRARPDIATWDSSVKTFEVRDARGEHLALIYFDFFERPGEKRAGAWASVLSRSGQLDGVQRRPVVINVTNFKKPAPGTPALLSASEVQTLFHEGGHGLHSMLSQTKYRAFSGTNVAWDFVELPSQFMENFAFQKEVLDVYARHYKTGERLPDQIIAQMKAAENFRIATTGLAQVRMSLLDLAWHTRDLSTVVDARDVAKFERQAIEPYLISKTYGVLSSTTFTHVFQGGYDAGYYSYKWADVLASDAFEAFRDNGIFDPLTANRWQASILEKGGVEPADQLYRDFRGRDADPAALLRKEGLLPAEPVGDAAAKPAA